MRAASTNSTATWPSATPGRGQRQPDEALDLERGRRAGGASPMTSTSSTGGAAPAAYARRRSAGRRSGACARGVRVVGLDDPLHEAVAHDVVAAEADEVDALDVLEDLADDDQPRPLLARAGRSG